MHYPWKALLLLFAVGIDFVGGLVLVVVTVPGVVGLLFLCFVFSFLLPILLSFFLSFLFSVVEVLVVIVVVLVVLVVILALLSDVALRAALVCAVLLYCASRCCFCNVDLGIKTTLRECFPFSLMLLVVNKLHL